MTKALTSSQWFQEFITEAKATIIETSFSSKWIVIEGKWKLGDLIVKTKENFTQAGIKQEHITTLIAETLEKMNVKISERELYRCIRFRKEYPDIGQLPGGKEISWYKIANRLLPGKRLGCTHPSLEEITSYKCKVCGQILRKLPEKVSGTDIRAKIDNLIAEFLEKTGLSEVGESRQYARNFAKHLLLKYPREKITGAIDYFMEDEFWKKNLVKISKLYRLMPQYLREGEVSEEEL